MIDGARAQILNLIQQGHTKTAAELANDLSVATPSIRRHLDILQRDNLVKFQIVNCGRGRPQYVYSLTDKGQESLPKDYPRLAIGLLHEIRSLTSNELRNLDGEGLLSLLLGRMAQRSINDYSQRLLSVEEELEARVEETVLILRELGFSAEYEQNGDIILIKCYNCPYYQVALTHPRLCELDLLLIQGLLKTPVERQQCPAMGAKGCTYAVYGKSVVVENSGGKIREREGRRGTGKN